MTLPAQSILRRPALALFMVTSLPERPKRTASKQTPQTGRFIQKIQRHVDFSVNTPPRIGPQQVPMVQIRPRRPIHLPRSWIVERSAIKT